jgi:glycerophosphoryl diester phosphodiesterase
MANKYAKWTVYFFLGIVLVMSVIYGSLAFTEAKPTNESVFFSQIGSKPLVIAHRGGAGLFPENTLYAFERATNLGVDVIELDVHSSSDGELVVIHDANVQRTTEGVGMVNQMTLSDLKALDAGYRFSTDEGKTFPLRGKDIKVPMLREVFKTLPNMRFNIEPKQTSPSIIRPLCSLIHEYKMTERVVVGSFHQTVIDEFRRECPDVSTSASTTDVSKFLAMYKTGLSKAFSPTMQALQVPEYAGVSSEFVQAAHEGGLKVHVWTVNKTEDMKRLLEMGVDGIMTDYPDHLLTILNQLPQK